MQRFNMLMQLHGARLEVFAIGCKIRKKVRLTNSIGHFAEGFVHKKEKPAAVQAAGLLLLIYTYKSN